MTQTVEKESDKKHTLFVSILSLVIFGMLAVAALDLSGFFSVEYVVGEAGSEADGLVQKILKPETFTLDIEAYDKKMREIANYPAPVTSASSTATSAPVTPVKQLWPVKAPYPKAGALLPFNRIVAYYGNFYSTKMGALGEHPEEEMLRRFQIEIDKWEAADPSTPVIPAIDYIAMTAQKDAGSDGKYRLRMPDSQIDIALALAEKINGIVILEFQVGLSDMQTELPLLEKYLKMPNVHVALDPEFAMHNGQRPGEYIGSMDAVDINYTAQYLARLVNENNLPPKIIIVHRFTQNMVTNYQNITPLPEVQIVMDMDGWGSQARKINTYKQVIQPEPVQFTGFKLFYKNDFFEEGSRMMTPSEVLKLQPQPSFIQYQ